MTPATDAAYLEAVTMAEQRLVGIKVCRSETHMAAPGSAANP